MSFPAQIEFRLKAGSRQADVILEMLRARAGEWVPMPELVEASGSYVIHSRVADLRREGWPIEHRNEWHERRCHSYYRLVTGTNEKAHPTAGGGTGGAERKQ